MKRGHDKLARVKHEMRTLAKADRALQRTMTNEEYFKIPDESALLAERRGLFEFWVYKIVR